jgi:hypothetical protein
MVEWRTSLSRFEARQTQEQHSRLGGGVDESRWPERDAFYRELEKNRQEMLQYVQALASIAGITHTGKS